MLAIEQAITKEPLSLHHLVAWQDPERLSGVPCFTNTRIPIKTLFDYLEAGDSIYDFLDAFPGVTQDQVTGALRIGKGKLLKCPNLGFIGFM